MPKVPKPINSTTFEVELLGKDKVEIGDKESLDFKPSIKLNRWDGECFIKVSLPTTEKITPVIEGGKTKWIGKDIEANFYPSKAITKEWREEQGLDTGYLVELSNHIISIDGRAWAVDSQKEADSFQGSIDKAFGDVLVAGLGFGLFASGVLNNPNVSSVTTIELLSDVVDIATSIRPSLLDSKHTIIVDNFMDYCSKTASKFDFVYGDIWSGVNPGWQQVYDDFKEAAETVLKPKGIIDACYIDDFEDPIRLEEKFTREVESFEFEIILKAKPQTNKIVLDIEAQGLVFYYQPPLTQEEIDEGCIRPDNVVGSYAVYHSTRTGIYNNKADAEKYKVGKAFHIYRPKITDANGKWVWGELSLSNGILTTIIPQDFLDSAAYPVSVDPNFGYEGEGASSAFIADWAAGSLRKGNSHQIPEDGTAVSLSAYIGGNIAIDCKAFINEKDSGGADIHGEIATKENLACGTAFHWEVFTLNNENLTSGTYYILNLMGDPSGLGQYQAYYLGYDNDTYPYYTESQTYGTPESPWAVSSGGTVKYSIYCTYEEEAGVTHYGAATLSGVGTLAGIGRGIFIGQATLSGAGTLAGIGRLIAIGKTTLSGTGSLAAIGSFWHYGKATLSGIGTLASIGRLLAIGQATLSGVGTLVAIGRGIFTGKATLSGIGSLSAIGQRITYGVATLIGQGTLVASAVSTLIGKATLSGIGSLSAIGSFWHYGVATLSGAGTLVANGVLIAIGQATMAGTGSLSAIGRGIFAGVTTLSGVGTLATSGVITVIGKAVLSGIGTLTASGFIVGVIRVTLALYNRALTATLYSRSLTAKLYNRSLAVKLFGRSQTVKLYNRAITLKKRVE